MTTRYFRQYIDEKEPEEISKEEAIEKLLRTYFQAEEVLATSSREHPVRTPAAYYWKEEG